MYRRMEEIETRKSLRMAMYARMMEMSKLGFALMIVGCLTLAAGLPALAVSQSLAFTWMAFGQGLLALGILVFPLSSAVARRALAQHQSLAEELAQLRLQTLVVTRLNELAPTRRYARAAA